MATNPTENKEEQECEIAYENPKCPYVTQINLNTGSMHNVNKSLTALLGPDGTGLNKGVIHKILLEINEIKEYQKTKLSGRDKAVVYGSFITAVSLVLVELIKALPI